MITTRPPPQAITLMIFLGGFTNNIIPILVYWLESHYVLDITTATLLQSCYFIGYLVMGLPSAYMISHSGHRRVLLNACALGFIVSLLIVLLPQGVSCAWYFCCIFALACSITALRVSALPYLAILKNQSNYAGKMSFFLAFDTFGGILAPMVSTFLIDQSPSSWLTLLRSHSQISILFLMLTCLFGLTYILTQATIKHDAYENKTSFTFTQALMIFRRGDIFFGFLSLFLFVGVEFGVVHELMYHLRKTQQFSDAFSASCISFYWVQMLVGRVFVGSNARRISDKLLLLTPVLIALLFCLGYVVLPKHFAWYALLLVGTCNASLYPSIYGVYTRTVPIAMQHYASCICLMATSGGACIPLLLSSSIGAKSGGGAFTIIMASYIMLGSLLLYKVYTTNTREDLLEGAG